MTVLYAIANHLNGYVIGTTNKAEMEIGYFTKHGDGGVDVEPLADLTKRDIYELAKLLPISDEIIKKKPSADLWEGQTDQDEMGFSYDILDDFIEGKVTHSDCINEIRYLHLQSEHKRNLPPVFKIPASL